MHNSNGQLALLLPVHLWTNIDKSLFFLKDDCFVFVLINYCPIKIK